MKSEKTTGATLEPIPKLEVNSKKEPDVDAEFVKFRQLVSHKEALLTTLDKYKESNPSANEEISNVLDRVYKQTNSIHFDNFFHGFLRNLYFVVSKESPIRVSEDSTEAFLEVSRFFITNASYFQTLTKEEINYFISSIES